MRDPETLAKLRAMYAPLRAERGMAATAGYVVVLADTVADMAAEIALLRSGSLPALSEHAALLALRDLVARHGSMAKAARALHTTDATISRVLAGKLDPSGLLRRIGFERVWRPGV